MHYQRCEPFPQTIFVLDFDPPTFHRQALLQDRLTDLEDLIRGEDGQPISQDLQNLIVPVLSEIESWLNRGGGAMTFEAQIILSNTATCNGPPNDICNQSSCKVQQIYLNIFSYSTYNLN